MQRTLPEHAHISSAPPVLHVLIENGQDLYSKTVLNSILILKQHYGLQEVMKEPLGLSGAEQGTR